MTTQGPKVIRRYANRKLYDIENSKYTTLKQLVVEVVGGRDVHVIDNVSQTDITVPTLLRAIVESDDGTTDVAVLSDILRAGGLNQYIKSRKDPNNFQRDLTGV